MAIKLTTTSRTVADNGLKVLVYGEAGVGKTTLNGTATNNVIISAEAGLLSLSHVDIPVIEVSCFDDVFEAYRFVTQSEEAKGFEWVSLDSISEIAEVCLSAEKKKTNDGRKAYGTMNEIMADLIRDFRDLPNKNVYFSAKEKEDNDTHRRFPMLPGATLGQQFPYWFDEVFNLRVVTNQEGHDERWMQTQPDPLHVAKDRSGRLEAWEQPNLDAIAAKIFAAHELSQAVNS